MENLLTNFSASLAALAERAGQSAVGVEARHRMGSSGFFWKPGIIVTASHAVRREEDIPIILPDGRRATASLAGRDPATDVAILRTEAAAVPTLTRAPLARTGEIVLAVGRHEPGVLAAFGIISTAGGPWKTWRRGHLDALLRLDIGAFPRSSGSAVVDTEGRLAGMLTTGLTWTAPVAIPASTIERVASELLEHGRVASGYLGVGLQPITLPQSLLKALKSEQRAGLIVLSVEPDGPADRAGILPGDVLVEVGGHPVTDTDDVQTALQGAIGKEIPVVILRGGTRTEIKVRVGERKS